MQERSDHGLVMLDRVAGFSAGEYASSPHGCQARILQTVGEGLTYDDLVCYSGFAFRTSVHDAMCPSAAHPYCGYMCMEGSSRALPWRMHLFESAPWDPPKDDRAAFEAEARAAVKDSIDRGVPVHYGGEEDGLIVGYADDGRRWWCVHPYWKNGTEAFWHDEAQGFAGGSWPWGIVVWTEPKPADERVTDRELTLAALRQTVDMWTSDNRDAYFVGDGAYAHWLQWLRDVNAGAVEDPKSGMQGNGWCFDVLVQNRRIAQRWLQGRAAGFDGAARRGLQAAAEAYGRLVETCTRDLTCTWDLAPGPDRADTWTGAMRRDQIARLEAARDLDGAAIAAIREAIAAAT